MSCISPLASPRPAVGTDIGEGVVVRYDEMTKELVGLTLSAYVPARSRA